MVGGQAAGDPLAKGMSEHPDPMPGELADHLGNVAGMVVQGQPLQGPGAAAHAARLRA